MVVCRWNWLLMGVVGVMRCDCGVCVMQRSSAGQIHSDDSPRQRAGAEDGVCRLWLWLWLWLERSVGCGESEAVHRVRPGARAAASERSRRKAAQRALRHHSKRTRQTQGPARPVCVCVIGSDDHLYRCVACCGVLWCAVLCCAVRCCAVVMLGRGRGSGLG